MSGPDVEIRDVSLRLGSFRLRNIALTLAAGEILVILGPNGAGKSLTLEAIAGFRRLSAGSIAVGGRELTPLPPERRHIALVFQDFGLFPHLTVAQNIAFPRHARARAATAGREPEDALSQFGIADLALRYPHELSPGQKQRVAIARALSAEPELFLFDEPFSAIDLPSRDQLRAELRLFLREAGLPAIFVTHDRTDASALADRLAVLCGGEIVQSGAAGEVFERPKSALVAELVGVENVLSGHALGHVDGALRVRLGDRVLLAAAAIAPPASGVAVCIRAEDVALHLPEFAPAPAVADGVNRLGARVVAVTNFGPFVRVNLDCGFPLVAHLTRREWRGRGAGPGAEVVAEIEAAAIHLARVDGLRRPV